MNIKRSKLVQVMVVAIVVTGLLIAAWPGMAQNDKPPLRPELKQFREDRLHEPQRLERLNTSFPLFDGNNRDTIGLTSMHGSGVPGLQPPVADSYGPVKAASRPTGIENYWSIVVFASYRDNNWEIYTSDEDGTSQARRTSNSAYDSTPKLNRGANRIAFVSNRNGNNQIYVMNADGSGQTRLTNTPANEYWPTWSPDGAKIAFYSYRDGNAEIYVMNANGSNQVRLTNNPAWDGHPAWSPSGTQLVFASDRSGSLQIYTMLADGSSVQAVTNGPGTYVAPAWAP